MELDGVGTPTVESISGLQGCSMVNIVKNTVSLSESDARVCGRWRKPLKLLALKRYPVKEKKQLLQQGGFFGALLPIIATVLGSLITNG